VGRLVTTRVLMAYRTAYLEFTNEQPCRRARCESFQFADDRHSSPIPRQQPLRTPCSITNFRYESIASGIFGTLLGRVAKVYARRVTVPHRTVLTTI
jgi:hypothetical protein